MVAKIIEFQNSSLGVKLILIADLGATNARFCIKESEMNMRC